MEVVIASCQVNKGIRGSSHFYAALWSPRELVAPWSVLLSVHVFLSLLLRNEPRRLTGLIKELSEASSDRRQECNYDLW